MIMDVKFCIEDEHLRVQYTPAEEILQAEFGEITEIPLTSIRVDQTEDGAKVTAATNEFVTTAVILNGKDGYTPVKGKDYFDGKDGESISHRWDGTTLIVASASGTSSADLKGKQGDPGYTPVKGKDYFDGKDGYTPIKGKDYFDGKDGYTPVKGKDYFDGKQGDPGYTPVKGVDYFDGEPGKTPVKGQDYFTEAEKAEMVAAVKAALTVETWTFTLEDGSTVTKDVCINA